MLQKPLLKIRNLKELQSSQRQKAEQDEFITPLRVKKARKPRNSATKNKGNAPVNEEQSAVVTTASAAVTGTTATPATPAKRSSKSALKEPPPSQLRIDRFFKTCPKTYKIEPIAEEPTPIFKKAAKGKRTGSADKTASESPPKRSRKMGRKRLFVEEKTPTNEGDSACNSKYSCESEKTCTGREEDVKTSDKYIDLISDSEEDDECNLNKSIKKENVVGNKGNVEEPINSVPNTAIAVTDSKTTRNGSSDTKNDVETSTSPNVMLTSSFGSLYAPTPPSSLSSSSAKTPATRKRKPKPCPPYKIVEGTSFAVDAFQYGYIAEASHYFLTHFHADHYIGLTRKFAMPLYMSTITARLIRTFIPVEEQYIHELALNTPTVVNDIEITALDANHCPGAVMLLFKFRDTGKCILHTGDFRAWFGMESEPDFWNNDIHTIYLDTTYISQKYAFCTQYESIARAKRVVSEFQTKHANKRILYICGSYVIGKEKFWSSIAEKYNLKVWTETNRAKAIKAMEDTDLNKLLVEDTSQADMHVISMMKISYLALVDYFSAFEHQYDIVLALRPSGWEKDSKPQYRGKINIVGIEYSEHSSYEEMQRFVKFLKPKKVISTVPTGRDLMKTAIVPEKWYKYDIANPSSNYQPRIEQFMGKTPKKKSAIRLPNENKGGLEACVSPLKKLSAEAKQNEINNNINEVLSIRSSEKAFDQHTTTSHMNPFAINENTKVTKEAQIKPTRANKKTAIKQEKKEKEIQKSTPASKVQRDKKEPKTPEEGTDLLLHTSIKEGEIYSICSSIPPVSRESSSAFFDTVAVNNIEHEASENYQPVSTTNSSDLFEASTSNNNNCHSKDPLSPAKGITASQKRNTRLADDEETKERPTLAAKDGGEKLHRKVEKSKKKLSVQFEVSASNNRNRRCKESSTSGQDISASQKRNTRLAAHKKPKDLDLVIDLVDVVDDDKTSSQNSSSTSNARNQHYEVSSTSGEEIPVSQKRNGRRADKKIKQSSGSSGVFYDDTILSQMTTNYTKQIRSSQTNPLLKSTTTSYQSSLDAELVEVSYSSNNLENTPRPNRNVPNVSTYSQTEHIPASQTTIDLNATPRPLRNKIKNAASQVVDEQIAPSQTTADLENTPRPLRNKMRHAYLWQVSLEEEEIPASQTSNDLANTPRPIRNKRSKSIISDPAVSPPKRSKSSSSSHSIIFEEPENPRTYFTQSIIVDRVLKENKELDVYNTSQLAGVVSAALGSQVPDTSVDHIPPELLSDPDAEDDWIY